MKQVSNKDYGLIVRYLYDYMVSMSNRSLSTRELNRVRICGKLFKKLSKRL